MTTFSIEEALRFGWDTFKKDPWFYVGVTAALTIFSVIVNALTGNGYGAMAFIGFLIGLAASTVVTIAYARLALSVQDGPHVGWEGLWAPEHFLNMLGATILQSIAIVVGLILLIIPGIIVALMLMFTQFLVVDKKMSPIAALKESYRLTKGQLLQIFLFWLAIIVINLIGLIALVVGLLVTLPVTLIAVAHVYKKLSSLQGQPIVEVVEIKEPTQS
jgi:uncharacterized membrane protein